MSGDGPTDQEIKAGARAMWASGDFPRVSRETVAEVGPALVAAAGVRAGQRVLDVAAGSGNTAIPAARTGAAVVASDLTPELFDAGRAEARDAGVELEWVEGDAEALPFDADCFDVVLSSFGAMFAPRHQVVADELLRVCKPGGTIAMANWTPQGWVGQFFLTLLPYMPPPPPGALPPILWGSEDHVRELLGGRVASLELERRTQAVGAFAGATELIDFYRRYFGPTIVAFERVADHPDRQAALETALLDLATTSNLAGPDEPARWEFEYLMVVARGVSGTV